MKKIKRALISVSDKKNLNLLLKTLKKYKVEIISTGGTFKKIKKLKYSCREVSEYTGASEILEGRVKTLHPKIHAGILNKRENKSHKKDLIKNNFKNIDLVIVNFYPFEEILKSSQNHKKIIENIDVGGPTMVRAAAKNYNDVTVIVSNDQYGEFITEMNENSGSTSLKFREKMSRLAFSETAYYDAVISDYFNKINNNFFTKKKIIYGNLIEKLRYGENPHQQGAIYSRDKTLNIKQLHNYMDIFAALTISKSLPINTGTVIIKHTNPCGVSILKNKLESYKFALACDPVSAFGGIVSCNFKITRNLAIELNNIFLEVVIGNGFDEDAFRILKKRKNLRLIDASGFKLNEIQKFNSSNQAILIQSEDTKIFSKKDFEVVSKKKPTKSQINNLIFAFNVCRFVKSNAIVVANPKDQIVAASDAFFPFIDGVEKLIQPGVSAVIQPAGSIRDKEIIKFANETGTVLVFSKTRHFKH